MMTQVLLQSELPGIPLVNRGKVRDIYDLGEHLLIVTSDRISAFDVIMNEGIPGKGFVLTQISKFWFDQMGDLVEHHLISTDVEDFPVQVHPFKDQLEGRSMLVKKAEPLAIECIVRGYLSGSGWKEYQQSQSVCGLPLPAGLVESAKLEEPIFTPSTKAEIGEHDENISFEQARDLCPAGVAEKVKELSLEIYSRARDFAATKGIIIADTKFEFGLQGDRIIWIDEALTPDSSRFWPEDLYAPGKGQPSFDKQFVRDYLNGLDWAKQPPAPTLPDEIVQRTSEKYHEALERLTR